MVNSARSAEVVLLHHGTDCLIGIHAQDGHHVPAGLAARRPAVGLGAFRLGTLRLLRHDDSMLDASASGARGGAGG